MFYYYAIVMAQNSYSNIGFNQHKSRKKNENFGLKFMQKFKLWMFILTLNPYINQFVNTNRISLNKTSNLSTTNSRKIVVLTASSATIGCFCIVHR